MANNVTTWIKVEEGTPEVYQKLKEMFDEGKSDGAWDTIKFYETLYPEYVDEDYDRETFTERMGAKWCYIEWGEIDDDDFQLTTISAWDWCRGAFERLHEILHEVDPNVVLSCTFEDEYYNFVGGAAIKEVGDLYEYSDDTLEYPQMSDFENTEDYDRAVDKFYDSVNESITSCVDEAIEDATWVEDEDDE